MFLKISHGAFTSAILSKKANKQLFALCELTKCGVTVTQLVQVYCNIKRSVLEYASRVPQNLNYVTGSAKKKGITYLYPQTFIIRMLLLNPALLLWQRREELSKHVWIQENIRGQRGTLPVIALWYVIVTKVIHRLTHKRKSVFRDVRVKTMVSA